MRELEIQELEISRLFDPYDMQRFDRVYSNLL